MSFLPSQDCTCESECDAATIVTQVPGPAGQNGINGLNGTNGLNAFTTTTLEFFMPAELATVVVDVVTSLPFAIGQIVYVKSGGAQGYFEVTAKPSVTQLTLKNIETTNAYTPNSPVGTSFAPSGSVQPGGYQGPSGIAATLIGSGAPEGVQTAAQGIFYYDTAGPALYIKGSVGTGNTGWQQLVA